MGIRKEKRTKVEEKTKTNHIPYCDFCGQEFPDESSEDCLNTLSLNPTIQERNLRSEEVIVSQAKSFNKHKELHRAVRDSEVINFRRKNVMKVEGDVGHMPSPDELPESRLRTELDDSKISYDFHFHIPNQSIETEASIKICDMCADSIYD